MKPKVVLVEFNELSPALLTRFMSSGDLPNFRRFYESAAVFTTDADAQEPYLEPWIQWPTVHLGMPHEEHGIRHLGDQGSADYPPLGQVLSDQGIRVGVCGSMNVRYDGVNGFYLPDPWNSRSPASPASLLPFQRTVSLLVQESSKNGASHGARLPAFGAFMARNGLTPATAAGLLRQLVAERRSPEVRWRRASCLDSLQYDLFRRLVRRHDVQFATFFSNSTAHYQHYYWRNMEPSQFTTAADATDGESLRDAIRFGYQSMDRLLARFMSDFPDAVLVLCTALSQEPWRDATKMTYRPRNFDALLQFAGVEATVVGVEPVMAEEFIVRFGSESAAIEGAERFAALTVEGEPALKFVREGDSLVGGCSLQRPGVLDRTIAGGRTPRLLGDLFHPVHTVRSGRHHPEGALWFRTGSHLRQEQPASLIDIAPTILQIFSVDPPAHMRGKVLPLAS